MSDDKYVQMFTTLNERVAKMSDEEMKNILVSLVLWRSICSSYQPEFYVLANAIDKALVPKVNLLSAEKTLQIFEVLYQLRLLKTSDFVYNATKRLSRRVRKLTSEQLVLFLFYLNSLRTAKKYVEFLDIEEKLSRVVNKLTIEEIGVACAGFFKTESYLHYPELIDAIVTKMIQNADTAPEITLVCIMKRYCSFIPDRNKKLTFHQKFEVEVMDTLKRLTGDQYSTMYLLPNHPRADHVVRWDSKNDFSPLPDDFAATEPFAGLVRSPGPDYVAVVPVTRNMFLKNGNDELMGECVVKIRQLKALGYRPVVNHCQNK
ncbi:unnamed protein product [Nesidiocoris tenuis]|uniref:RAP domain-containing protein n=1 Tax=Nesidiocoris tenuis TaxID=355587 RepID=A0A6H5HHC9_9HEMI|nr:unnamed protein product [Nesidiocoris tenuis]